MCILLLMLSLFSGIYDSKSRESDIVEEDDVFETNDIELDDM